MWNIQHSDIEGEGVFAKYFIPKGTVIDVGINFSLGIFPNITFFGSKLNHSYNPNSTLVFDPDRNIYNVEATKDIPSCREITIDYRDTPFYIKKPDPDFR